MLTNVDIFDNTLEALWNLPSALGMGDPIWGPFILIFVDEKKDEVIQPARWKG